MGTVSREFDSYKLWYLSGHEYSAVVLCYKESLYVGRIIFFREGFPLPPNRNLLNGPSLHFSLGQFGDLLSILRHERPLYLFLNLETLVGTVANSHFEVGGEEEE